MVPLLSLDDFRRLVPKAEVRGQGARLINEGHVANLCRVGDSLFGEVRKVLSTRAGPKTILNQVTVNLTAETLASGTIPFRCSCPVAKSKVLCDHVAALLLSYHRSPQLFTEKTDPPEPPSKTKSKTPTRTKRSAKDPGEILKGGVAEVVALISQLALSGVSTLSEERLAQIATLGEGLRQSKLRRLSGRTLELLALLRLSATGSPRFSPRDYVALLADLLLTTRKLERHLNEGHPLEDRLVEELIGKTWTEGELTEGPLLNLLGYASHRGATSDDFTVAECRLFELTAGVHYVDKQITPSFLASRLDKPIYVGSLLGEVRPRLYPTSAPQRLRLPEGEHRAALTQESLRKAMDQGILVPSALSAFAEQRRDPFAPTRMPVALRVAALYIEEDRLYVVDPEGNGLPLPTLYDPGLAYRARRILGEGIPRLLFGDLEVTAGIPTVHPFSLIVETSTGHLSLRIIEVIGQGSGQATLRRGRRAGRLQFALASSGIQTSTDGKSGVRLVLESLLSEIAECLCIGLATLPDERVLALALSMEEEGLAQQGALLRKSLSKPANQRLEDFIKLHQVLETAQARSGPVLQITLGDTVCEKSSPGVRYTQGSLTQRQPDPPSLLPLSLWNDRGGPAWGVWANASLRSQIVKVASEGGVALPAILKILRQRGFAARITALCALAGWVSNEGATNKEGVELLNKALKGEFNQQTKVPHLAGGYEHEATLRVDLHGHLALYGERTSEEVFVGQEGGLPNSESLQRLLLGTPVERQRGVQEVAYAESPQAGFYLWISYEQDPEEEIRAEALLALARLGDPNVVPAAISLLEKRSLTGGTSQMAALALGLSGDIRGVRPLCTALLDGYNQEVMARALGLVGRAALEPLVELVLQHPELEPLLEKEGSPLLETLTRLPQDELTDHLVALLSDGKGGELVGQAQRAWLIGSRLPEGFKRQIAHKIRERLTEVLKDLPASETKEAAEQLLARCSTKEVTQAGAPRRRILAF